MRNATRIYLGEWRRETVQLDMQIHKQGVVSISWFRPDFLAEEMEEWLRFCFVWSKYSSLSTSRDVVWCHIFKNWKQGLLVGRCFLCFSVRRGNMQRKTDDCGCALQSEALYSWLNPKDALQTVYFKCELSHTVLSVLFLHFAKKLPALIESKYSQLLRKLLLLVLPISFQSSSHLLNPF
jgi:hypothetical protein